MLETLHMLGKAAVKRARPITKDTLDKCKNIERHDAYYKVDYANYLSYHFSVDWPDYFMHPCYLQMVALPLQLGLMVDKHSPFNATGIVHIHNHVVQQPDIDKSQPFALGCRFGKFYRHKKGIAFEIIVTGGQKGKCVYEATGTYLDRRTLPDDLTLDDCNHLPLVRDNQNTPKRELGELEFESSAGRKYALISKDYNPIHLSALSARLFGFKKAIAHGMFSMACALSKEENILNFRPPNEPVVVMCDFAKPILLPAKVRVQSGPLDMDRLVTLMDINNPETVHLFLQYSRGEAARLHRGLR